MKILMLLAMMALTSCTPAPPVVPDKPATPVTPTKPAEPPVSFTTALSWENTTEPHPERAAWSQALTSIISADLATYEAASDMDFFCPPFKSLTQAQKVRAVGEMWVAIAYHESGYNPKSEMKEKFSTANKDTWSVGLFQMSQVDQENYGFKFGFSYEDLLTALPNIKLATSVMKKQIVNKGKILITSKEKGVYWSTIHPGGDYDKSADIAFRVKKKAPGCK